MNQIIIDFMTNDFTDVATSTSSLGTHYVSGIMRGDRYMISKQKFYIITKRIDGTDKYIAVCDGIAEVCNILMAIKNNDRIVANDKAKFLASFTGFDTI